MSLKSIAFMGVLMFPLGFAAIAQGTNPDSPASNNPLRGLKNMNSPEESGSPLPPPTAEPKVKLDDALLRLCLKLKQAKANSDFCR